MKKILSTLIAVAFLSVAAGALAEDVKPDNSTVQGGTSTTSEKELERIHTSNAKKKAKKKAKAKAKPAGEAAPAPAK